MKTMSAVLFALLFASFVQAQQRWTRTYGGTNGDYGCSVGQTTDRGYIIAGYTNSFGAGSDDVYLIKTDSSGDTLWTKTYGGTGYDGCGYRILVHSGGGYIIAGYTSSFGAGSDNVYLIKTNASGDTVWTKTYGGTGVDAGYSVGQTDDGGYIITGYTNSFGAGSDDVYLIKTNASGDTLWTRTHGGANEENGRSVQQTVDGGYIIAGYTNSFGAGSDNVYLIKTNASGDTLWTRTYGGDSTERGNWVQRTSDGGYIIAGYTNSFGAGGYDVYFIRTNASGDTLWTRTYGGTGDDEGACVHQTGDGGYIIAGVTASFGTGGDAYLVKTNASGDTLWTRTYGGGNVDYGYSVQQTLDGGYIVAGHTLSSGAGGYDVYLIKTDASGSAGVEEPGSGMRAAAGGIKATPSPFTAFARIPGHETERFELYDISGKMVGTYRGNRIGEGLSPAVYFIRLDDGHGGSMRVVKAR